LQGLLLRHDYVIEVLATDSAPAVIDVAAGFLGTCAVAQHGRLLIAPLDQGIAGADQHRRGPGGLRVQARIPVRPAATELVAIDIFNLLGAIMNAFSPREVVVRATSCGTRPAGDRTPANREIGAVVRVYRKDNWELSVRIPQLGKFKYERTATRPVNDRNARYATESSLSGNVHRVWNRAAADDAVTPGFDLTVKRNNRSLALGETYLRIRRAVTNLSTLVADILEAINKAPQLGFKLEVTANFFAGTITLGLALQRSPSHETVRYVPLGFGGFLTLSMVIVEVQFEGSFGVLFEVSAIRSKVEGRIVGTIGLKAEVGYTFRFRTEQDKENPDVCGLAVTAPFSLGVVGEVTAFGSTLARAELSVRSGLELRRGQLHVRLSPGRVWLSGEIWSRRVTVSGELRAVDRTFWTLDNYELIAARRIKTF